MPHMYPKHFYLDKIKAKGWEDLKPDKRENEWQKQTEKYGFANYETWSLEYSFYIWLYEHINRYVDVCCVDLNFHKFMYNGKEYTQRELINEIIERLEFYFSDSDKHLSRRLPNKLKENKYVKEFGFYND